MQESEIEVTPIERLQQLLDRKLNLFGWKFEVEQVNDELTVEYYQGVDDIGLPGGIFLILLDTFEKEGWTLYRISTDDEESTIQFSFRHVPEEDRGELF